MQKLQKEVDRLEGELALEHLKIRLWLYSLTCFMSNLSALHVCMLISDELLVEKERVRNLTAEIEQTVQEIQGS